MNALLRLAEYEFFPGFTRRLRRVLATPFASLVVAFAVANVCGIAVHPRVFALAGGLAFALAVGVGWPWLTIRGLRATLEFECERVTEGAATRVALVVSNHLPWAARGVSFLGLEPGSASVLLETLPGRTATQIEFDFVPSSRGRLPTVTPKLATGFPFGLRASSRAVHVERSLIVWPLTLPVGPPPMRSAAIGVEGRRLRHVVGASGDILGVRPYRAGDPVRRIHWRQSARHDRLIVCELQASARPEIRLVLDLDSTGHSPGSGGSAEWAVRVAASFARGWLQDGVPVGLAWSGGSIAPATGGSQILRIVDVLAGVAFAPGTTLPPLRACRGSMTVLIASQSSAKRCNDVDLVTLDAAGFENGPASEWHGVRPWLAIESREDLPARLRSGWEEARHGA